MFIIHITYAVSCDSHERALAKPRISCTNHYCACVGTKMYAWCVYVALPTSALFGFFFIHSSARDMNVPSASGYVLSHEIQIEFSVNDTSEMLSNSTLRFQSRTHVQA